MYTEFAEPYRPQFHFTARKGWLNDPNGLVYYQGTYHLFFQHNPSGNEWGNMTWGHAISTDLIHWEQTAHALLPDSMGTMFSGSAVVDWHNTAGFQTGKSPALVLIYTAAGGTSPESEGKPFTQCLAYSNDGGKTFTKFTGNPVLPELAPENRDPKVIWHEPSQKWIMALYLQGEEFALLSSPNLKEWTMLQRLSLPGCMECPDFFELPLKGNPDISRWVFMAANGQYLLGEFDGHFFKAETALISSDWGKNFYATQTFSDIPDGRRIQMAWMRGGEYPGMPFNQQMGFPCELGLEETPEGIRVCRRPIQEIETLWDQSFEWNTVLLEQDEIVLPVSPSSLLDVEIQLESGNADMITMVVNKLPVTWNIRDNQLEVLDCSASLPPHTNTLDLRLLIDRTSLEVFSLGGTHNFSCCTLEAIPEPFILLKKRGGTPLLSRMIFRTLQSIYNPKKE
ncbi:MULTISPECIES: glycoside hydrolase family 32 protein [Anaerolinea]|uniref:glycoside hydrolase family 32 protein n=1 Tax=Anaerolinea TaxID=233189 RepID=UPI00263809D7|nr:glycoside hydrolase family 32 protein [Anaerolinea thermophila]